MFSLCLIWKVLSSRTSWRCRGGCETQPESRFSLFSKPHAVASVEILISLQIPFIPDALGKLLENYKKDRSPAWVLRGDFPAKCWFKEKRKPVRGWASILTIQVCAFRSRAHVHSRFSPSLLYCCVTFRNHGASLGFSGTMEPYRPIQQNN